MSVQLYEVEKTCRVCGATWKGQSLQALPTLGLCPLCIDVEEARLKSLAHPVRETVVDVDVTPPQRVETAEAVGDILGRLNLLK